MKDSLDRICFASMWKSGEDIRIEIVYEYSKSGQIVVRTANGVRQTYEYDKKGQLLAVKDPDGNAVERYCYDKAGNMLGTTVGSKSNGKYSAAALTAFGEDLSVTSSGESFRSPFPVPHYPFFTGKPYVEGLGHAFLMRNYRAGRYRHTYRV